MRKRTFMDPKFSAGDANNKAYLDGWERMFGEKCSNSESQSQSSEPSDTSSSGEAGSKQT